MRRRDAETVVELTLPSNARYLALVRTVVGAAATVVPSLSDGRIADLKLVATELFTNAMEANWRVAEAGSEGGASPGSGACDAVTVAPVVLRCRVEPDSVVLTVADSGPGLDASDTPHPPVHDPGRLEFERGLGIPLIQYLADKVDYVSSSEGTRATAVFRDRAD